jgi:hypothetical protein
MPIPTVKMRDALERVGSWSQPELAALIELRAIPRHLVDRRSSQELTRLALSQAEALGAVRLR